MNKEATDLVEKFLAFQKSMSDVSTKTYLEAGQTLEYLSQVPIVPDKEIENIEATRETCNNVQVSVQKLILALSIYCAECVQHNIVAIMKDEDNPEKLLTLDKVGGGVADKVKEMTDRYVNFKIRGES